MSTPITDLQKKGFVVVSYPPEVRVIVQRAMESWKKFYSLPMEIKEMLSYSSDSAGVGYEFKKGDGPTNDRKENFDITWDEDAREELSVDVACLKSDEAMNFVRDAFAVVQVTSPMILDFARQVENNFDVIGFAKEVEDSRYSFFYRFIHYPEGSEVGEVTAKAHADQSGFTLHLFESAPGLQCLPFGGGWTDMPVSDGETVIINSMQMQLRTNGVLKALGHRVVANDETAKIGRDSAVCFVQLKDTPKYDKARCGRIQDMKEGFNYDISHEDFKKFFKK